MAPANLANLANLAAHGLISDKLSNADRLGLIASLQGAAPFFEGMASALGLSDVQRYSNWLKSIENVFGNKAEFNDFLGAHIINSLKDPREILAIVDAGYLDPLKSSGKINAVALIEKTIEDYRRSYPDNQVSEIIFSKIN